MPSTLASRERTHSTLTAIEERGPGTSRRGRAANTDPAPARPQNFGPDIQKDIDTVKDDCFQCRAAAARRVPA